MVMWLGELADETLFRIGLVLMSGFAFVVVFMILARYEAKRGGSAAWGYWSAAAAVVVITGYAVVLMVRSGS